ncbi:MAG: HlyD family efflux transporter periplasmic adaptor subunit [Tenuifilaceae bacterium]|jgi:HlyD family secretion protein|uniref:efflux RND transporter periplasmic adaptor subunit n=1 Tax=Perlabentimonas gracilis TaxID=2715279 RepID=UPI0014097519|nr:HlyD family efflux transporter periplasmic adaptor subunit [Perlabentimonas gracilis]MDX9769202.1 HlyD family efflux transporter periplasmic adaptor subunit [Tenuifilaceae bacterium]NHB67349.1 HlyD family efflux transporter periplasmic adaptor subunit [Perlabentimonas gracilis]
MDRVIKKKRWPLKKVIWIVAGAAAVLLIGYYIVFADKSSKLNVDLDKLTVETVVEDLYRDYITVIGTVAPIQTIYLDATEGGSRVDEIITHEGSWVNEGDIIARFSNTNLILEISNFEANVSRANNELSNIRLQMERTTLETQSRLLDLNFELMERKRTYENNKKLFDQKHISNEEYERSKEAYELNLRRIELFRASARQDSLYRLTQMRTLEEDAKRLQQNLSVVRNRLEALVYRAPVSGELASLNLEVGQVIGMGTRIGAIHVLDSYMLKVDIDEHYIARINRNLTGECEFSGNLFPGHIAKVYPEVRNGRFTVDMVFDSIVPPNIRIGQTSRIRLELGESMMATLIPRGGFYQSTGGQWIYVVDPSGKYATKRPIRINRQNPRHYEVTEGLQAGERVIVSSYDNFGNVDRLILRD